MKIIDTSTKNIANKVHSNTLKGVDFVHFMAFLPFMDAPQPIMGLWPAANRPASDSNTYSKIQRSPHSCPDCGHRPSMLWTGPSSMLKDTLRPIGSDPIYCFFCADFDSTLCFYTLCPECRSTTQTPGPTF